MDMKGFSLRFRIESKLFNGYVIQPIPIVILSGFTLIAFLFIAIWCTVEELSPVENTEYAIKESMFVSYSRDEYFFFMKADEYIIKTDDDGAFSLPVDAVKSEEILEKIIKNRMPVFISYNVPSNQSKRESLLYCRNNRCRRNCDRRSRSNIRSARRRFPRGPDDALGNMSGLLGTWHRRLLHSMPRPRAPASGGAADTAGIPQFLRKGCARKRAKQMSRTAG